MSRGGVRRPLTRQRSGWEPERLLGAAVPLVAVSTVEPRAWRRRVHDGTLRAFLTVDGPRGWHLSISHTPNPGGRAQRYPTWDEIADARDQLTDPEVAFSMILPVPSEYVALSDTTFHLHEIIDCPDPGAHQKEQP